MNRYNVLEQLGVGAFGVVYRAEQKATGEIVAIKRMKQRFVTWEECLQLREIISLRRLQHPNVIKLKEVVRENAELCMVFEFMEQNVYQIMKSRASSRGHSPQSLFDEKEIRSILTQTLLGLQAVHRGGFMHRDLKPENLLTKGDMVKIADFGLAKEIRSRPPFTEYVSTRWYRAPEIILRSDRYNSPIDIWALGVIAVELYLNRPLFPGSSDADQLFKVCSVLGAPSQTEWDEGHQLARKFNLRFPNISPTPLRQILSSTHASPAALDLFDQMLKFNPSERPTATQCLMHPFITGENSGGTFGNVPASMFTGISSGQSHNPFHAAQGVPGGSAQGSVTGTAGGPQHPPHPSGGSSGSTTVPYQRTSPSPNGSPTPGGFNTGTGFGGGRPPYGGVGAGPYQSNAIQQQQQQPPPNGYTGGYSGGPPYQPPSPTSAYPSGPGHPQPAGHQHPSAGAYAGGQGGGPVYRPSPTNTFNGVNSAPPGSMGPGVQPVGTYPYQPPPHQQQLPPQQQLAPQVQQGSSQSSSTHQHPVLPQAPNSRSQNGPHHLGSAGPLDEY